MEEDTTVIIGGDGQVDTTKCEGDRANLWATRVGAKEQAGG